MAVEAPHNHMNLFPSHILTNTNTNRETMKGNNNENEMGVACSTMAEPVFQFYQSINKSDSGLTFQNNPNPNPVTLPLPRKRSRDSLSPTLPKPHIQSPFLHHHLLHHLHHQQSQIDTFIAQHMEKVRLELEEQRVRQSRTLLCVIQDAVSKKLKEKEQEIERITKLNWVLQERVRSLTAENQAWKELAHTNEAAANSLRSNLEQVLAAHLSDHHADRDAESSCSSNTNNYPDAAGAAAATTTATATARMCNKCGVRESIVLLLPCRHLCLCTMCASAIRNCPLCHTGINASVHVNFS